MSSKIWSLLDMVIFSSGTDIIQCYIYKLFFFKFCLIKLLSLLLLWCFQLICETLMVLHETWWNNMPHTVHNSIAYLLQSTIAVWPLPIYLKTWLFLCQIHVELHKVMCKHNGPSSTSNGRVLRCNSRDIIEQCAISLCQNPCPH